jgi:hypothetical protein
MSLKGSWGPGSKQEIAFVNLVPRRLIGTPCSTGTPCGMLVFYFGLQIDSGLHPINKWYLHASNVWYSVLNITFSYLINFKMIKICTLRNYCANAYEKFMVDTLELTFN